MRLKSFITGGTGFVGNALFNKLHNHDIYLYSRGENPEVIKEFNPDFIFHIAGEIYDEDKMFDSNITLTYRLLNESKDLNYKAFIYVGSSSEYGRKDHPMSETDHLDPTNLYEATKGAASLLCQAHAREYGKPVMVARPFSLYGKGEPPHRFIPTVIRCAKRHEMLKLAPGNHDFIHINDFVDGLIRLANRPQPGEAFNFGTGIQLSNQDVVEIVEEITGKKIRVVPIEKLHDYDSDFWVCDNSKATKSGWKPTITFYQGIEKLCRTPNNGF